MNKNIWITAKEESLLNKGKNPDVEYIDEWSNTQSKEIPDFCDISDSKEIRTSVILQLRIPNLNSSFGFISFESPKCIHIDKSIENSFLTIAKDISDYLIKTNLGIK